MAKLRRARAYRAIERPYTRISKYKKKSFIRVNPQRKVVRFDMGDPRKEYFYSLHLVPKMTLQIRQESMESARQTAVRVLEKQLGKNGFHFKIRIIPYHVLRENPLASGAGADRMSTGMARPFGKAIGISARIKEGHKFMTVSVDKDALLVGKKALQRAARKLSCSFWIRVEENIKKSK